MARFQLIEINGVLFAVLKCQVQQKRHRASHDKTSGLSSDTALYPHEYKNLHGKSGEQTKNAYSQTSLFENPEELQLHYNHEKYLFLTVL
jgi:hypothetical protein